MRARPIIWTRTRTQRHAWSAAAAAAAESVSDRLDLTDVTDLTDLTTDMTDGQCVMVLSSFVQVAPMDGGRRVGSCATLFAASESPRGNSHNHGLLLPNSRRAAEAAAAAAHARALSGSSTTDGFAIDWDRLSDTWECLFSQHLQIDPTQHSFVMSTLPDMRPASRATALEAMFETFDAPCLRMEQPAVLALHASGRSSGLVIDCGARLSIMPIVQVRVQLIGHARNNM